MADFKLDIFAALTAMDRQDGDWLSKQPEEARKGFAPPVFLRFAATLSGGGVESEYTLMMVNERVNKHANEMMGSHPDLMYRLAASCGLGSKKRHEWLAGPKKASSKGGARSMIELAHPFASYSDIDLLLSLYTEDEFCDLANGSGCPEDDIKAAIKAFRASRGSAEAKATKRG